MRTATASPRRRPSSSTSCTRRSAWRWSATTLYVANTDAMLRFPYHAGDTRITEPGEKFIDLPAGPINHHWTKNLIASPTAASVRDRRLEQQRGENGIDAEGGRAAILEVDPRTGQTRVFATGLRNPNGMAWQPDSGALWTAVNERDELGNDLVPDYMTSVQDGAFYGWPYSYYGQHVDDRVKPQRADLVQSAIAPDYALGSHTASLGLTFYERKAFPAALPERRVHRPAWVVEPQAAQRLQGRVRAVPGRQAVGSARGHPDRVSVAGWPCVRAAGWCRGRSCGRVAGRGRRRQCGVARGAGDRPVMAARGSRNAARRHDGLFSLAERQVIELYDAGVLSPAVLQRVIAAYTGRDVDWHEEARERSVDGRSVHEVVVLTMMPGRALRQAQKDFLSVIEHLTGDHDQRSSCGSAALACQARAERRPRQGRHAVR